MTGSKSAYIWDEAKRKANIAKHGVDFLAAEGFEWETALVTEDTREEYGEERAIALGFIGSNLHVLVFTERKASVRVISLRKATKKERDFYGKG